MYGIKMKGKRIIIPLMLHNWILMQLHSNNMGTEKDEALMV